MKALTFSKFGNSDVLNYIEIENPILKSNEILVEMKAIGLNFADIYRRKGNYHITAKKPYIAGYEGAGIVVNGNNSEYKIGDRVAFADVPLANAELVAVPLSHVIQLKNQISFKTAASTLLQGLTAHYLATDSHFVKENEVVLIHAAAGGVGQILTQICKMKNAKVIGLTTSKNKEEIILKAGADVVFNLNDDWKAKVLEFTNNKGVDVAYDSVGSTLGDTISVTKECGHIVFFGMSGGDPLPVDPRLLMDGSKTLTGGDLWSYLTSKEERINRANQLFDWILSGKIKLAEPISFKLSEGKQAHDFLESGKSAGKILLIP